MHFMVCGKCKIEGSMKPFRCSRCDGKEKHVYKDMAKEMKRINGEAPDITIEETLQCSDCYRGMGNKDVIDVSVLHCLFCKWRVQTFYEYGIGKMKCTNCHCQRTSLGIAGMSNEQYCNCCNKVMPELWIKGQESKCRACWAKHFEEK